MKATCLCLVALLAFGASSARAAVRITEWMYNGSGAGSVGEFVELTNFGPAAVNMTGWSFDDDSRLAGTVSLSAFGVVAVGESVILTDNTDAAFKTTWGLSAATKVIGGNSANLSRNDEINIYNGTTLVDRLTYGDQNIAGTIRTQAVSGNPLTLAAVGANSVAQWKLAIVGDGYGSIASTPPGDVGNPGKFTLTPEPTTLALAGLVLATASLARRRR